MARIRTLKPEFFRSRSLAKCERDARTTFQGLWCEADDAGVGIADARILKGSVWPLDDDITAETVEAHLQQLAATGHISLYVVDDERYYVLLHFDEHQAAAYRRGKPQYPPPPEPPVPSHANACKDVQERADPCNEVQEMHDEGAEIAPEQGGSDLLPSARDGVHDARIFTEEGKGRERRTERKGGAPPSETLASDHATFVAPDAVFADGAGAVVCLDRDSTGRGRPALTVVGADLGSQLEAAQGFPARRRLAGSIRERVIQERAEAGRPVHPSKRAGMFKLIEDYLAVGQEPHELYEAMLTASTMSSGSIDVELTKRRERARGRPSVGDDTLAAAARFLERHQ